MKVFTSSCKAPEVDQIQVPEDFDSPATAVFAFVGAQLDDAHDILRSIEKLFPTSIIAGCSTAGEICGDHVDDASVVVAAVKLERSNVRMFSLPIPNLESSERVGRELAQQLDAPDLAGVMILSDGLSVDGAALVDGVNLGFTSNPVVSGGLAGDADRWTSTWVVADGEVRSEWVTAVGFYGSHLRFGHGCFGGWDAFGPRRVVTRATGTELFELDGKPALSAYKPYLGDLAESLPAAGLRFPWALRRHADDDDFVMRTVVGTSEINGSMSFAGSTPTGSVAQLMSGNLERLIDGAAESARQALDTGDSSVSRMTIAISCVGRRAVLQDRISEELEAVLDVLGPNTHMAGFYSYGEISQHDSRPAEFHNQTMTLTTFAEV